MINITPATVETAVSLAEAGLPVFPCTLQKGPMTANGFKDATLSPAEPDVYPYKRHHMIEGRGDRFMPGPDTPPPPPIVFGKWPDGPALIGVPTGAASGLVVIDVDSYKADEDSEHDPAAKWLSSRRELLRTARIHRTGSGGVHYIFRTADQPIRSRAGIKVGGETLSYVDIRADGGYVIWWAAHGCAWDAGLALGGPPNRNCGDLSDAPIMPAELLADLLESCREVSTPPSGDAAKRDEFVRMFQVADLYRREKAPGVHCVTCPWIEEHPNGKQSADDTAVYFEPYYNGRPHSAYVCKDAACDGKRTLRDLRERIGNTVAEAGGGPSEVQGAVQPANTGRPVRRGSETDDWITRIETARSQGNAETLSALLESWRNHLMTGDKGNPLSTPKNTLIALGYAPETYGAFVYDEFAGVVTVTRDLPHMPHMSAPYEWQDDLHWMPVASWLNRYGIKPDKNDVCDAVRSLADLRRQNSARDYFESLTWDGTPRLDTWLQRYLGASGSDDYLSRVGGWFLSGVAARACQPGAKQDYSLVLVMKQGVGKTTVAETLAVRPEWFTDRVSALGSKDSLMELRGRLIVEMAELEVFRKSDVETQKAFLTCTVDKYRAPYGRSILAYPRTCCFVGTTNENKFLHDLTGNRRFWPVQCGERIDMDGLRQDLNQLYAEAYARWKRRERYWPAPADNPIMEREQERYRIVTPLEETILATVMLSPPLERISADDLYGALGMHDTSDRTKAARQVSAVMRKLGYRDGQRWYDGKRRVRGWALA